MSTMNEDALRIVHSNTPTAQVTQLKPKTREELLESYNEKIEDCIDLVRAVAKGHVPGAVISGPHGVGKSHVTCKVLTEEFPDLMLHTYKGKTTPLSLYNNLYMASDKGNIILFDDNDSAFDDPSSLNTLKAALDPTTGRVVTWSSTSGKVEVPRFEFNGGVIILTNQLLHTSLHFAAVKDRVPVYTLNITLKEVLAKIQDLAESHPDQEKAKKALKYMSDNMEHLRAGISLRTFHRIMELIDTTERWERLANNVILGTKL